MKTILFFSLLLFCHHFLRAQNSYNTQWKIIDALIQKKHLPKSALAIVKKIYGRAKREGNDVQLLKTLIYQIDLQEETREDNELLAIAEIEKERSTSREPFASLLNNLLAGLYRRYFEAHRWQLYDRTANATETGDGIANWTAADFHKKISGLYLASLQRKELLQQTPVDSFAAVVVKGNAANLRPTLYDLLAYKALTYFESDEQYITKPKAVFTLDDPALFAPAETFSALALQTADSASLLHKALLLHRELLAFHAADKTNDALIDDDIRRIEFVNRYATMNGKDSLYEKALLRLTNEYAGNKAVNEAGYLLAKQYNEKGESYHPFTDTAYRYGKIEAVNLLTRIVADSSVKNEGWTDSYNLLQEIKKPSLQLTVEKVNLPGEPFRTLVKYKNLRAVTVNLLPSSQTLINRLDNGSGDYWKVLASQKPIKSWRQSLPETGDYQAHSVEIKIDALPVGDYFLVLSDGGTGSDKTTASASRLWVSNIGYINRGNDFFVLHRKTGEPFAGASVTLLTKEYNDKLRKFFSKTLGRYTTNNRGFIRVSERDVKNYYTPLSVTYKDETLALEDELYLSRVSNEERTVRENGKVFFFTDRAIYRPAQTVYFKALLVRDGSRQSKTIVSNQAITVYLYDANDQKRDSLKRTSNDYGSVAGQFHLPATLLNGNFSLRTTLFGDDSRTSFSVEEYKRPTFYVDFEKVKGEYKLGDSVRLTLTAKAFAGSNISGAKVSYRVVRNNQLGWKRWQPRNEQQILSGEKETGANGSLTISFKALPDESLDSTENPVFDYFVTATVTDVNGETHSEFQTVSIGYASLLLTATVPEKVPLESFKKLFVQTQNLQGEFVQAPLTITFFKLSPEPRLLRSRLWDRPDRFVMNKPEYVRYFPFDEYDNESSYKSWPKEKTGSVSTVSNDSGEVLLKPGQSLNGGHYLVQIIAKDKNGKEVKTEGHVELFSPQSPGGPQFLWTHADETVIKPGGEHHLQLATAAKNVYLIKENDRGGKSLRDTTRFAYERLSDKMKMYRFDATEADRGGYNYAFLFVNENRVYQYGDFVNVLWNNKDLAVSLTSFRDKTEPGSKEKWKVKISGDGGKKVSAEMLASMYDASLDEFRLHNWDKPYLWRTYKHGLAWTNDDFGTVNSEDKEVELKMRSYVKRYDQFLFDRSNEGLWWLNPVEYRYTALFGYRGAYDTVAINDLKDMSKVTQFKIVPRKIETAKFIGSIKPVNQVAFQNSLQYGFNDDMAPARGLSSQTKYKEGELVSNFNLQQNDLQKTSIIQPRKNLSETAFFFPFLTTDTAGDVEISFTAPEALTKWKLQTFAHTKDLAFGLTQKELITQKSLMVQPAVPRFVRQKDSLTLQAKIANLSNDELKGEASLQLFDAATNEAVDAAFNLPQRATPFSVKGGRNTVVNFTIAVPQSFNSSLTWRITASANGEKNVSFSDGEEATLPVLPNKILLTETIPLVLRGTTTKEVKLDKLLQPAAGTTLQHQSLTVEATTNPAWYAVQALPYLMEFPYECAEQTWNRYYANALASVIVKSSPKMKAVFDKWKKDTTALLSNLQKNEELKSALLQETPWVIEAQSEAQQKSRLGLLFDEDRIKTEGRRNLAKLRNRQKTNGAFAWFDGGPEDRYITQYILTGLGRLLNTKGFTDGREGDLRNIATKALAYLDNEVTKAYKANIRYDDLSAEDAQYLYLRSFFTTPVPQAAQPALAKIKAAAQRQWMKATPQVQGMIALAFHRSGEVKTAAAILASLKETAIVSDERGMYWKGMEGTGGLYWEDAPIETAALLTEAFAEAGRDDSTVAALQTWLIQQKQTTNWGNTKATADACFAILKHNASLLNGGASVSIRLGRDAKAGLFTSGDNDEEGTGYFKRIVPAKDVQADMGHITVQTKNTSGTVPVWASVYWQYFEAIDKATTAGRPLRVSKELLLEKRSDNGLQLVSVTPVTKLKPGDKLTVRLQLSTDRDLQYVHLKDLRASCLEPLNVFSGYRWQNGTGYYEETKDMSTNFFFDVLPKGTYVFDYPVYVAQSGEFGNGLASVQCMYAPQFAAHSEGGSMAVKQ